MRASIPPILVLMVLCARFALGQKPRGGRALRKLCALEGVTEIWPGHTALPLDMAFARRVLDTFEELEDQGLLEVGLTGHYEYPGFAIQL